jgi:opacity protein-like surface antigen
MKQAIAFLFASVLVLSVTAAVSAQTMGRPVEISAGAIDLNNGRAGMIQMTVDRWSTAADRAKLGTALSKDPDELLKVVQSMKSVGRIRTPDSIGYDLRYAQERPGRVGGRDNVHQIDRLSVHADSDPRQGRWDRRRKTGGRHQDHSRCGHEDD